MTAVCHYLREDTLLRMQILKHLASTLERLVET